MYLPKKYHRLKVGTKIKINNNKYTIKEKIAVPARDEYHDRITRYEFDNNYVLEYEDHDWKFFEVVEKKFFFFDVGESKVIDVEEIEII